MKRYGAEEALRYDDTIKKLIPLYDEIQFLIASLLPYSKKQSIKVLDLGCGTGGTGVALLKEFPLAVVTGIDNSSDMISRAQSRVKHTTWKVNFLCQDLETCLIEDRFDAIISGFSIHYLDKEEKATLFSKCFSALKEGGVFIDAEFVMPESDRLYDYYMEKWEDFMRSGEVPELDIEQQFLRYRNELRPPTMDMQKELLIHAGFKDVECFFKYMNWAVFGGYKPAI